MSELRVDTLKPALNPSKITITPGVVVEDNTGVEQFEVTSSGEIKVLGPLRVGSAVSNTTGSNSQVLTSQGTGLPPVWAEGFPFGGIIMWYGLSSTIPLGWKLCDGQTWNGFKTPDLRDRFVVGAGTSYTVNQTGGSKDAVVVSHTHTTQPHTHTLIASVQSIFKLDQSDDTFMSQSKTITTDPTTVVVNTAGESGVGKNLPPYYALCYIMRVPTS